MDRYIDIFRSKFSLITSVALVFLCVVLLRAELNLEISKAQSANITSARSLAANIARVLHESNGILARTSSLIASSQLANVKNVQGISRDLIENFDGSLMYVTYMNAEGDLLWSTAQNARKKINYSDREYFRSHIDGADYFVGAPIVSRVVGVEVLQYSRAIRGKNGVLQGVLFGGIRMEDINRILASSMAGNGNSTTLFREDGLLLARIPAENIGKRFPDSLLFERIKQAPYGSYDAVSKIDGKERLIGYAKVEGFPLIAASTILKSEAISGWRVTAIIQVMLVMMIIAVLFVTARRESEKKSELERSNMMLQKAMHAAEEGNRAKTRFLSSMSHELRTPLNSILGNAQLLACEIKDKELLEELESIQKSGWHLLDLINQVLDLTRIEQSRAQFEIEAVNAGDMLEECAALCRTLAQDKKMTVRIEGEKNIYVKADNLRFKQALLNFLSNAVKYGKESSEIILMLTVENDKDQARILVRNFGAGIEEKNLLHLFEPFNRLGYEGSHIQGIGLGLAITRQIVEQMGGQVGASSEYGKETSFWLSLPLAENPEIHAKENGVTEAVVQDKLGHVAQKGHVLYVEDNLINARFMRNLLSKHRPGVQLTIVETAEAGMDAAISLQPDLLLLDINLPGMSGLELLKRMRECGINSRAFALTAAAMPADVAHGKEAGFEKYITKPIKMQEFLQEIDAALAGVGLVQV